MASILERDGKWQAKVRRKGQGETMTFVLKTDAVAWARKIEGEIERGEWKPRGAADATTLACALDRYEQSKTVNKKSKKRETSRIAALKKLPMAKKMLSKIRGADIAKFRDDERARGLAENSIRLNIALLSHLFKVAATEWKMEGLENPCKSIEQPKGSNERSRRLVGDEESRLLAAMPKAMPRTPTARALVVIAIETGMRESELLGLMRKDAQGRIAHLDDTKSGLPRDVPLSILATETIAALPSRLDGRLFGVSQDGLIRGFKRACTRAGIEDLTFHDLRHEAASRLAEIYEAHELAKIFGWKTIQMAMRYYHPRPEQLLNKMDAAAAAKVSHAVAA